MEETEYGKGWLVMRGNDQSGLFSRYDLMVEAARGKLHPRRDMVWKSGMAEWIPAGEVEGLFKRNEEAMAAEQVKPVFTEYKPELSAKEKKIIKGEWTGTGRGTYLFLWYILPFLWVAVVGYGIKFGEGIVESQILTIAGLALCVVPFILVLVATFQRFQNLCMSRLWFFGLFVPLLNLWVWYRLFACPPGYAHHKKLDMLGWVLAIFHWGSTLLIVVAFGFTAYTLTQAAEDDAMRIAIEDYIRKIEEDQKAQEKR